jgi:hypothetical protein
VCARFSPANASRIESENVEELQVRGFDVGIRLGIDDVLQIAAGCKREEGSGTSRATRVD